MRVHIVDFAWQVGMLSDAGSAAAGPVVSLSPEASYELHRRGMPFLEPGDLSPHAALWRQYPEISDRSLALAKLLDKILHAADSRYAARGWKLFDAHHYIIKIAFDQLLFHADLIAELSQRFDPHEFVCADSSAIRLGEYGLFHPEVSTCHAVLAENAPARPYAVTSMRPPGGRVYAQRHPRFSFGQPARTLLRSSFGASTVTLARAALSAVLNRSAQQILSVGSKEIKALSRSELRQVGIRVTEFPAIAGTNGVRVKWCASQDFALALDASSEYRELAVWRGISFASVLRNVINFIAAHAEDVLNWTERIFSLMDRVKPSLVIFQTMAPFYLPNVSIRWWCEYMQIPYACWMHGGYGANYSLAGYDIVDYRLAERHILYGAAIADVLEDESSVLNRLAIGTRQTGIAGSPYFDRLYGRQTLPITTGSKPRITLAIGVSYAHNQFYFGYDRAEAETSLWRTHLRILQALLPFQDRFSITLKDYPGSPRRGMWQDMLDDIGARNIAYVSDERSFADVLRESDLNIFPWISTTFFQALYSDADVFVLETGDVAKQTKAVLAGEVFIYEDVGVFCAELGEYLDAGKFCRRTKQRARQYFLDLDRRDDRARQLAEIVRESTARSGNAGQTI